MVAQAKNATLKKKMDRRPLIRHAEPRSIEARPDEKCRASRGLGQKGLWFTNFLIVVSLALMVGCGPEEEPANTESPQESVVLLELDEPLRDPVWSPEEETVFALRQDGQAIVRADTTPGGVSDADEPRVTTIAEELEGEAGENMVLDLQMPNLMFIPQPGRDEVRVMETDDLLEVRTFDAGTSPARVAMDGQAALSQAEKTLFTLSGDGSTVTGVSIEDYEVVDEIRVDQGREALLEAPREGEGRQFWIAGSGGVALYSGSPLELQARTQMNAGALAVDANDFERAYASETASGRVVALEPGPEGDLGAAVETDVGGEVLYLLAGESQLYAVTQGELISLDPATLESLQTVSFKDSLEQEALENADPSGVALGEESVYLTLDGEPYMLQIERP